MKKSRPTKHAASKRRTNLKKRSLRRPSAQHPALKRPSAKSKAAPKSKNVPATVDQYFATLPQPARSALQQIREAIRSVVPQEAIEIISYKIPAFKHKKVLVWYAAFSNHCSLFPTAAIIEAFKDELTGFSTTKGTLHFSLDKPMPVELIKRMVKARVERAQA